jgi:hypothetical protein
MSDIGTYRRSNSLPIPRAPTKTSDPTITTIIKRNRAITSKRPCRSECLVLQMVSVCTRRRTAVVIPSTFFRSVPSPDVACNSNSQRSTSLSLVFAHRELNKCVGGSLCDTRLDGCSCARPQRRSKTRPYRRSRPSSVQRARNGWI